MSIHIDLYTNKQPTTNVREMSEKTKVSYYVSTPVARGIRLLAAKEERTLSEVAETALEAYLSERQEDFDWQSAAEGAFEFWDNPIDAAYDDA